MKIKRFRDLSLSFKIWIVFISFVIPCIIILSVAFKLILDNTRDKEIFSGIIKSQQLLKSEDTQKNDIKPEEYNAAISVYHIGIENRMVKYMTFPGTKFSGLYTPLINVMGTSFSRQKDALHQYQTVSGAYTLYYVIVKKGGSGIISFRIDPSVDPAYRTACVTIIVFSSAATILTLIISLLLAKSIARPLQKLEKSIANLAAGDLETSVLIKRNDEIGKLSKEMEKTRIELSKRKMIRQSTIQYISHELKTPVMTITSYAQSILDKVYPRGSLEGSVKVIEAQSHRLYGIIIKLITISKLDYLETKTQTTESFDLAEMAEEVCTRAGAQRPDVGAEMDLENIIVNGQREQIEVMLENLCENAFRYAEKRVAISVAKQQEKAVFSIFNDGGGIDEELMPNLFEAFKKGKKGISGLGLSIVKRIADSAGAEISVQNIDDGVRFCIIMNIK